MGAIPHTHTHTTPYYKETTTTPTTTTTATADDNNNSFTNGKRKCSEPPIWFSPSVCDGHFYWKTSNHFPRWRKLYSHTKWPNRRVRCVRVVCGKLHTKHIFITLSSPSSSSVHDDKCGTEWDQLGWFLVRGWWPVPRIHAIVPIGGHSCFDGCPSAHPRARAYECLAR